MKNYQFLIFFSVVLLIYSAINYYIYHRGMQALASEPTFRIWFRWGFVFLAASYVAGRFLERVQLSVFSDFLVWTGSFWLAIMFYLLLAVMLVDIIRLLNVFTGFLPASLKTQQAAITIFFGIGGLVLIVITAGYINAISPRIKKLEIDIAKKAGNLKELNVVMASDIHMGTVIGPRRMAKLVKMINSQHPDIILFAGDIVDEDLAPVVRQNLGSALLGLKAPMGIFGITGNHEYIGGAEAAVKYLQDHGLIILRDSVVRVGDSFYLVGREDRDKPRFSGRKRMEVDELLKNIDKSLPIILLDHQPFNLEKAQAAGADLQLSGHTHHGQIWPLNYITSAIYEVSMGYLKKGDSHFYVSPGFGGWGPPVRIGNRPEIVNITLRFKE